MLSIHIQEEKKVVGDLFNYLRLNGYRANYDNYGDNIYIEGPDIEDVLNTLDEKKISYIYI